MHKKSYKKCQLEVLIFFVVRVPATQRRQHLVSFFLFLGRTNCFCFPRLDSDSSMMRVSLQTELGSACCVHITEGCQNCRAEVSQQEEATRVGPVPKQSSGRRHWFEGEWVLTHPVRAERHAAPALPHSARPAEKRARRLMRLQGRGASFPLWDLPCSSRRSIWTTAGHVSAETAGERARALRRTVAHLLVRENK